MTCQYVPGKGTLVSFSGPAGGVSFLLSDGMTIAAAEENLRQLAELTSA